MSFVPFFEWTFKPLKSIFCILVTYPIIEVTFIIQAMNQWASSSSFRAWDYSPQKKINWNSFFVQHWIWNIISATVASLEGLFANSDSVNLIWLNVRCKTLVFDRKCELAGRLLGAMLHCCFWSWSLVKMTYFSVVSMVERQLELSVCEAEGCLLLVLSVTGMVTILTLELKSLSPLLPSATYKPIFWIYCRAALHWPLWAF